MSYMIRDLKKLYASIVDDGGNYLPRLRGVYQRTMPTQRELDFLKGLIHLVMTSKIVSSNTKAYIKSNEKSVKSFVEGHNILCAQHERLKASSVSQSVDYDRRKLLQYFPDRTITDILSPKGVDISDYEKKLNLAIAKFSGSKKILNNLALKIDRAMVNDFLAEKDFRDLISTIAPYTKQQIKFISENIPAEQVGYLNYLLSGYSFEGADLERLNLLKALLEGSDEAIDLIDSHKDKNEDEDIFLDFGFPDIDFDNISELDIS